MWVLLKSDAEGSVMKCDAKQLQKVLRWSICVLPQFQRVSKWVVSIIDKVFSFEKC